LLIRYCYDDERFEKAWVVVKHGRTLLSRHHRQGIKHDSFTCVAKLDLVIDLYVAQYNTRPKPFVWATTAKDILAQATHAKASLSAAVAKRRKSSTSGTQRAAGHISVAGHTAQNWRPSRHSGTLRDIKPAPRGSPC
jgi:hypothetical protein